MIGPFQGDQRFLSNFSEAFVELDGEMYPTVEHTYQAAKTLEPEGRALIRQTRTPGRAKRLGLQVALRPDWDRIKVGVMLELLRLKFTYPDLRDRLLATGTEEIVEINTWHDTFWGVCNGHGQNQLGRLLMQVRSELAAARLGTSREERHD